MKFFPSWLFSAFQEQQRKPIPGLPPDLDVETVRSAINSIWGKELKSAKYAHLSGWKKSGAYRITVKLEANEIQTFIFKNCIYDGSEIPALKLLNIRPGQSEYSIYSDAWEFLKDFLPRPYYTEFIDDKHFILILEDVSDRYVKFSSARDIFHIIESLTDFHNALLEALDTVKIDGFISYNQSFYENLVQYAEENILKSRLMIGNNALLDEFTERWPIIKKIILDDLEANLEFIRPVHGDLNLTNVLLKQNDKDNFLAFDWEWAGYSYPHWDLASLLKGKNLSIIEEALKIFSKNNQEMTFKDHYLTFLHFLVRRCILDASFMNAQLAHAVHDTKLDKSIFIEKSLLEIVRALQLIKKFT